jgi:hypothetical protein
MKIKSQPIVIDGTPHHIAAMPSASVCNDSLDNHTHVRNFERVGHVATAWGDLENTSAGTAGKVIRDQNLFFPVPATIPGGIKKTVNYMIVLRVWQECTDTGPTAKKIYINGSEVADISLYALGRSRVSDPIMPTIYQFPVSFDYDADNAPWASGGPKDGYNLIHLKAENVAIHSASLFAVMPSADLQNARLNGRDWSISPTVMQSGRILTGYDSAIAQRDLMHAVEWQNRADHTAGNTVADSLWNCSRHCLLGLISMRGWYYQAIAGATVTHSPMFENLARGSTTPDGSGPVVFGVAPRNITGAATVKTDIALVARVSEGAEIKLTTSADTVTIAFPGDIDPLSQSAFLVYADSLDIDGTGDFVDITVGTMTNTQVEIHSLCLWESQVSL